ncbi:multidrug transporter [uncultured Brevibacterium sp.]|uniref:multidrug transporter n=1 Tax=uncultured Brevibacterium sp. TaxID=189678 RepID=UPI0025F8FBC8|nr:multidrug transporter [uncultured Brevibacterium sp.]
MNTTPIALCLAVVSAVALAFGAVFQHRGVNESHATGTKFGVKSFLGMFSNRTWVLGMSITVVGVICGTLSLALAAVMVVQPVGAISLVISVLIAQRTRHLKLTKRIIASVAWCTVGVGLFVFMSAMVAKPQVQQGAETLPLVWATGVSIAVFTLAKLIIKAPPQLVYVIAGGILFACVATNTHVVSVQFLTYGIGGITWLNVAAIVLAGLAGSIFVQSAYASGPPELVIAGLTVIDPIVAVFLGAVILGEAADAPVWAVVVMSVIGLSACGAVFILSKYHPDVLRRAELKEQAGT